VQIGLADFLADGVELELGHAIHRIYVIHTLYAILIILKHSVSADIARNRWDVVRCAGPIGICVYCATYKVSAIRTSSKPSLLFDFWKDTASRASAGISLSAEDRNWRT
jgi:hypothetical protein